MRTTTGPFTRILSAIKSAGLDGEGTMSTERHAAMEALWQTSKA
jgi:hypothetical protein